MGRSVTLEIPEQSYRKIAALAEQRGQSLEAVVADTIEQIASDPFEERTGISPSVVPDGVLHEDTVKWDLAVARGWAGELADEREDIYTMQDGEPVDAAR